MKNLEQLRAAHALKWAPTIGKGAGDGEAKGVVKKIPALVIQCGLLSAMAFAKEKEAGYKDVFDAFIDYCDLLSARSLDEAIEELSSVESSDLRRITAEFMAYLGYLRRFV
ncbi:MAG: type III-B CRISPR module-associated protein Cmr5 [Pontiella sp.]